MINCKNYIPNLPYSKVVVSKKKILVLYKVK